MFFNLGIDSSMGGMEAICTGISDDWHFLDRWFRSHKRLAIVFGVHLLGFLVSLVNCTQGGIYALVWLDLYAAGISLISVGFCEAIAISYFYGIDRFSDDLLRMTGRRPGSVLVFVRGSVFRLGLGSAPGVGWGRQSPTISAFP